MTYPSPPPVLLIAGARERRFARALEDFGYVVVSAPTAAMSLEFARAIKPDIILIEQDSADLSAVELCGRMRRDVDLPNDTPVLIALGEAPTPEMRVAGLHAGAWDYLRTSDSVAQVALRIDAHVQARRNARRSVVDGVTPHANGVLNRVEFTQRLREFGALMVRMRGALTCVVFALDGGPADGTEARLIARAARASDAVGVLSDREVGVVAPATNNIGAVPFIRRMGAALREGAARTPVLAKVAVRAGYATVENLKYSPMNPIELLSRAGLAVHDGDADPAYPWIRRPNEPSLTGVTRWDPITARGLDSSLASSGDVISHERRDLP